MRIYVDFDDIIKGLTFEVNPSDTLEEVTEKVNAEKKGQVMRLLQWQKDPAVQHHLAVIFIDFAFKGQTMERKKRLCDYNVQEGDTIHVRGHEAILAAAGFFLYVIMPSGEDVTLAVSKATKLSEVKSMIEEERGLPPASQVLFVRDEVMDDNRNLSDYTIENEAVIRLEEDKESGRQSWNPLALFR